MNHQPSPKEMPKPAPRRFTTTTTSSSEHSPTTPKPPPQTATTNHKKASSSNSSLDEDVQVLPRPITNEEFQAMIPPHFLKNSAQNTSKTSTTNRPNSVHSFYPTSENACDAKIPADSVSVTTVTIKKPDPIDLPPPPTGPGRVTETITKSTFTETVVTRITDNNLVAPLIIEDVTLSKLGGSLGFSIIGGTDHSSIPFGAKEPGIFISHMVPGGTAAKSGKLRVGDRILKVNGTDVTQATHQEAVMELLRPGDYITLTIRHDPLPDGYQELIIEKGENEKLGMHIKGGLQGQRGNPLDRSDEGVFISKINSVGAARRDGRLKAGMRLLEVNGKSLLGATHQEAVNALRSCGNSIHLIVCKGYDKIDLDRAVAEGRLNRTSSVSSRSQSVSSLDVPDEDSQQEHKLKSELMQFEREEAEKRLKPIHQSEENLSVIEAKPPSPAEKVLDVVRAVETLAQGPIENSVPPKSPNSELKTTTIVMSKHTLAAQPTTDDLLHAETLKKIVNPNIEADDGSLKRESTFDDGTSIKQQIIVDNSLDNEKEKLIQSLPLLPQVPSDGRSESQTPNNLTDIPPQSNIASNYYVQHLMPDRVLSPPHFSYSVPLPTHASEMAYQPSPLSYQYQPYQNVIEMNNNSYGTITRISNYSSTQPIPSNVAMTMQSPMINGGQYSTNRFSMMSPPPPQQFEINVYNTLPQNKSFGNLNEPTYPQTIPNLPPVAQTQSNLPSSSYAYFASTSAESTSESPLFMTSEVPVASTSASTVTATPIVPIPPLLPPAPTVSSTSTLPTTSYLPSIPPLTTVSNLPPASCLPTTSTLSPAIYLPPASDIPLPPASTLQLTSLTSLHQTNIYSHSSLGLDSPLLPELTSSTDLPPASHDPLVSSSRPLILPPPLTDMPNSLLLSDLDMDDLKVPPPPPPPEFGDVPGFLAPDSPPPLPKTPPPSLRNAGQEFMNNQVFSDNISIPLKNKGEVIPSSSKSETRNSIGKTVEKLSKFLDESKIIGESSGVTPNISKEEIPCLNRLSTNRDSKIISEWMLSNSGNTSSTLTESIKVASNTETESIVPSQLTSIDFEVKENENVQTLTKPESLLELVSPKPFDENKPVYQKLIKEVTVTESSSTLLENQSSLRSSFQSSGSIPNKAVATIDLVVASSNKPTMVTKEMSSAYTVEKQFKGGVISKISRTEQISPPPPKITRPRVPPPPVPYKKVPPPVPPKKNSLRSSKSEENILDTESTEKIGFKKLNARPVSLIFTTKQNLGFGKETLGRYGSLEKPPQSPRQTFQKQSVSDKKKFFETAMEESQKPSKPEKIFSYLNADELEKLKAEEERKIATLSTAEISSLNELDHSDGESVESQRSRPSSTIGIVRTAKAEKRLKDKLKEEGLLTDEDDPPLSPAEERALRAEKRAAWRAARLKSLEQDAMQAQMVIKSMTDMVGSGEVPLKDDAMSIKEEVEQIQEKIISLELTKPDELNLETNQNGKESKEDDEDEESVSEPPTPTTDQEKSIDGNENLTSGKKKKRKRSKKSKN